MKILKHDILDVYKNGYTITIPTNGFIKKNGQAVMGAGVAKIFRDYLKGFDLELANKLKEEGNIPYLFPERRIITFPTKYNWYENSDLNLIKTSAVHFKNLINDFSNLKYAPKDGLVFLPIPGAGNGNLKKEEVLPVIEAELSSLEKTVILVERP